MLRSWWWWCEVAGGVNGEADMETRYDGDAVCSMQYARQVCRFRNAGQDAWLDAQTMMMREKMIKGTRQESDAVAF